MRNKLGFSAVSGLLCQTETRITFHFIQAVMQGHFYSRHDRLAMAADFGDKQFI
jgi:hypothetical protein